MNYLVTFFEWFMALFQAGGDNLVGLITGMLPTLACLLTFITAIIKFVGEERVEKLCMKGSRFAIVRYIVLPFLGLFIFTNPMCFTAGRFLPEKYKAAFFDATCGIGHPITGLFPHASTGELFIWLGIAGGVEKLGYQTTALAIAYLGVGFVVSLVRGLVTEKTWAVYARKKNIQF